MAPMFDPRPWGTTDLAPIYPNHHFDQKIGESWLTGDNGKVATDARYAEYKDYDGFSFPSRIEIKLPEEEYDLTMNMLKVEINKALRDEQFVLAQPPGAVVVHLDSPQSSLVVPLEQK